MTTTPPPLLRDRITWGLYGAFGLLGFWLNGLGSVLAPLRAELGVSRSDVAFYPSLFALALLVMGVVGKSLIARAGQALALLLAVIAMAAGAVLLTLPSRPVTVAGAVVLGLGCALTIQVLPVLAASLYGARAAHVNTEANAASSVLSFLAPLTVAAAIALGAGWRVGYLVLPGALLLVTLWLLPRRPGSARTTAPATAADGATRRPLLPRWFLLVEAVSLEFCCVFWSAEAFLAWHRVSTALATGLAAAFLVGMALGRLALAPGTVRHSTRAILYRHAALTAVGFAVFWVAPWWWLSAVGLLATGVGVSLLYPVSQQHLVNAWPDARERAAGYAAMGSGVAIAAAPYVLAALADRTDVRSAYAIVIPVVLVALVALVPIATREPDARP